MIGAYDCGTINTSVSLPMESLHYEKKFTKNIRPTNI